MPLSGSCNFVDGLLLSLRDRLLQRPPESRYVGQVASQASLMEAKVPLHWCQATVRHCSY